LGQKLRSEPLGLGWRLGEEALEGRLGREILRQPENRQERDEHE
jgi:hypothetical protein